VKRNWIVLLVTVVALVIICIFLGWVWDTYGPNISLMWLAIIIAAIATISALLSLKLTRASLETTRGSLELTRATTRPFLNIYPLVVNWSRNDGRPTLVKNFIFGFCNTGPFPADKVSVLMKVNKEKMDNQQHLFAVSEGIPPICFPSEEITNLHFREVDEKEKLEVELKGKLKVRIEIEYENKLTQETCKTNRSYLVQYDPTAQGAPTPLPKEDYWD